MNRYTNLSPRKSPPTSLLHITSLQTNKTRKETLNQILKRIDFKVGQKNKKYSSSLPKCLYPLKIRNQVLILNMLIIAMVTMLYIIFQGRHFEIIMSMIANSSNQILQKQNLKYTLSKNSFQSRLLIYYMDFCLLLFSNANQALLSTNQIYNYALQADYTIDMGVECSPYNEEEIYPSYQDVDMFCYNPQGVPDLLTYQNTSLNTNFVKFNSILNMFILSYQFPRETLHGIQINLNNSDQMISTYPQTIGSPGYSSLSRPWYKFQENCFQKNISQTYYISPYMQYFPYSGRQSIYGEFQTQSLTSNGDFHGVIQAQLDFALLSKYFSNYNDVNLALLDEDGTILFEQTQINISRLSHSQIYIYNQSKSGFSYLDWIHLTQIANTTQSTSINNTLFTEPIQLNIAKFQELPFYFTLFNNLTYEMESQSIQFAIFQQLNYLYYMAFTGTLFAILLILTICYLLIINILKPINYIQKIIQGKQQTLFKLSSHTTYSNNILKILAIIIAFKYSELSNLMFKKGHQCLQIEECQYPLKKRPDRQIDHLNLRLLQNRQNIQIVEKAYSFALPSIQSEFDEESSNTGQNIQYFTLK